MFFTRELRSIIQPPLRFVVQFIPRGVGLLGVLGCSSSFTHIIHHHLLLPSVGCIKQTGLRRIISHSTHNCPFRWPRGRSTKIYYIVS